MKELETKLKLPTSQFWNTFKQINLFAIQYAHLMLIHKRRIENKQHITYLQNHFQILQTQHTLSPPLPLKKERPCYWLTNKVTSY
jgi:hypothetical protein